MLGKLRYTGFLSASLYEQVRLNQGLLVPNAIVTHVYVEPPPQIPIFLATLNYVPCDTCSRIRISVSAQH